MKSNEQKTPVQEIRFYDHMEDSLLKFAVIISKSNDKWVYCKHRERDTYEIPGGHREDGETILETARRELWEETGAVHYAMTPVCAYAVVRKAINGQDTESCGMLYYAEITEFTQELHSEIERIELFKIPPAAQTYPQIQPALLKEAARRGFC